MRTSAVVPAATLTALALLLSSCGGDSSDSGSPTSSATTPTSSSSGAPPASSAGGDTVSLADVCPATVSVQTDWNPENEHGGLYELVGPGYTVDADKKRVSGPLYSGGKDTGVKIEVRAGGPAIGFQTVTSQMYLDPDLTMGYVYTDEAAQFSAKQPTIAVMAPLEINPQMIMWDPGSHPDFTGIADIGKTDTTVSYFQGAAYMEYLLGKGILKKSQIDGSYDGSPATFVASGGKNTQQGFATAEPYIYQNEVKAWNKPVKFQLISDTGYRIYADAMSVRTDKLESMKPCLTKLVPVLQQAQVDFAADPTTTTKLVLELVKKYNTGWVYSQGVADFSVKQQKDLGILSNGPDATLGNFDLDRVAEVIGIVSPIFAKQGTPVKAGLTPADLVTNEFIDTSIGLK